MKKAQGKTLAYGSWTQGGFQEEPLSPSSATGPQAAYMALGDYILIDIEDGLTDAEAAEAWMRRNIGRFFPDDPDKHPFDILPGNRQAILTSAECLAEYRKLFPKTHLACLLSAFKDSQGDVLRVFVRARWLEWARRLSGSWTLGQRRAWGPSELDANPESLGRILQEILDDALAPDAPIRFEIITEPAFCPRMEAWLAVEARGDGGRVLDLETALSLRLGRQSLFILKAGRQSKQRAVILRIALTASLALLCLFFLSRRQAALEERTRALSQLKELRAAFQEAQALEKEIAALSKTESRPEARLGAFLSALSQGLDPGARLSDLDYESGSFNALIHSPNALETVRRLSAQSGFSELQLSNIQGGQEAGAGTGDSLEKFNLRGLYHEGP